MQMVEYISSGGVIALVGLMWNMVRTNGKENEGKISRVYQRLDEVKKYNEDKFIRKDMCELQHKQVNDNFDRVKADLMEIKLDIKRILNNGKK